MATSQITQVTLVQTALQSTLLCGEAVVSLLGQKLSSYLCLLRAQSGHDEIFHDVYSGLVMKTLSHKTR